MGYGPIKRCSCGKYFFEIPAHAKQHSEKDFGELAGSYWECPVCQSTLFMPEKDPDDEDEVVLCGI